MVLIMPEESEKLWSPSELKEEEIQEEEMELDPDIFDVDNWF